MLDKLKKEIEYYQELIDESIRNNQTSKTNNLYIKQSMLIEELKKLELKPVSG